MLEIIASILSVISLALAIYDAETQKIKIKNNVFTIISETNNIKRGDHVCIKYFKDVQSFNAIYIDRQQENVAVSVANE